MPVASIDAANKFLDGALDQYTDLKVALLGTLPTGAINTAVELWDGASNYARQSMGGSPLWLPAASARKGNANAITFPYPGYSWGVARGWALIDVTVLDTVGTFTDACVVNWQRLRTPVELTPTTLMAFSPGDLAVSMKVGA